MYLPKPFEESRPEALHAFMRAHPLATIVLHAEGELSADHVPLMLRPHPAPNGRLLGHVARANPLWRRAGQGAPCLAVFRGVDHYISPNAYATKRETGKVVPTWNYEAVHVNGAIRAIDDRAWLRGFLETLTHEHERAQPHPWRVDDAPLDYVETMLGAVVGIEIDVQRIVGKAKLSQNQPAENRRSLVAALRAAGDPSSTAMADAIESREPRG
ncbi:MAG TPA: FMN-binding negative transcriptional regulator [Zeimonas sp.]